MLCRFPANEHSTVQKCTPSRQVMIELIPQYNGPQLQRKYNENTGTFSNTGGL